MRGDLVWQELVSKAIDADSDAWVAVMDLWPEVTSGDTDPMYTALYRMVTERLAAHWAQLNHPDPRVRAEIMRLAEDADPYADTRGIPMEKLADPVSLKDWRPVTAGLRARAETTVDRILEGFFRGLQGAYEASGRRPLPADVLARYRPCFLSFFVHWLGWNYPDPDEIDALHDALVHEDPLFDERCGAGGP